MSVQQLLAQAKQAEEQKQWAQAAKLYGKVLEESPEKQPAKERLGWCLSRAKEYKRAISTFQELAQSQPQSAKWPYMIGYQYHKQQQWREAITWYGKSLTLNPGYIVALYRKGYAHFKLAQVGEALQAFERCRALWYALPKSVSNKTRLSPGDEPLNGSSRPGSPFHWFVAATRSPYSTVGSD
jgi:tetratricopeptide (TPR) repeat protein